MVDITFLEVHLDDSTLTANAPSSSDKKEIEASTEPPTAESSPKTTLIAALVGLVFLAAVAFLVRKKFLAGETDEDEEKAPFDVADVTA